MRSGKKYITFADSTFLFVCNEIFRMKKKTSREKRMFDKFENIQQITI